MLISYPLKIYPLKFIVINKLKNKISNEYN